MKGFKSTGKGPKYGNFTFPSAAGFGPSSGSVKTVSGYTRRAGRRVVKKAIGGLAEDNIVDTPGGPADFAKGGSVKSAGPSKRLGYRNDRVDYSVHDGKGNYEVASKPEKRAPKLFSKNSRGFNRTPKIGK